MTEGVSAGITLQGALQVLIVHLQSSRRLVGPYSPCGLHALDKCSVVFRGFCAARGPCKVVEVSFLRTESS